MKITTSLRLCCLVLFASLTSYSSVFGQCNDIEPPVLVGCQDDFTFTIQSATTCTPSLYWPAPTATDDCFSETLGFTGFMSYNNWTRSTSNGTAQFSDFTPDSIRIRGTTGGAGNADMCVRFGCSGTIRFDWSARKTGFGVNFAGDHAYYLLNGTPVQLTPGSGVNANGTVTVTVNASDQLCFRVASNNVGAQTILVVSNIAYNNIIITQTIGPVPDSYPGAGDGDQVSPGSLLVEYEARDCAGNVSTCSFNIEVVDTPPTIQCPDDVTILLDTFDCSRVYCYNVLGTDNCTNSSLFIPGMQYIGTYNGNTYFISDQGVANHVHWLQANQAAAQMGGHLVTIEDGAENTFLTSNIPFANPLSPGNGLGSNQYWIGLRYSPMLNEYKWTTGQPVNYTNWGIGQPGIIPGEYIWFLDLLNLGTWWDSPSLLYRRYIVEFEGGLPIKLLSGIPSGNVFPPGQTINTFQACDAVGNTASCSFTVDVIGSTSLSCKSINVSLDENCQILITPEMLLTGVYNCYDVFEVQLSYYGVPVPNPVDSSYLWKHLTATVLDPTTGNSCWSDVVVEDKLAPVIVCRADTVDCNLLDRDAPLNYDGFDCSRYSVKTINETVEHLDCNRQFLKAIYRDIQITDVKGNTDYCTDTILVRRLDIDFIYLPDDLVELYCNRPFNLDENGHPSPTATGLPYHYQTDGTYNAIWPLNELLDCHILITYDDLDLGEINCVRKIMRTWTIREWWCNQELVRTVLQVIVIKDNTGPVITHMPYGFDATTGKRDCKARVLLPAIEAVDGCHNDLRVDVAYPGGILIDQNGGYADLPVGEDTVYYRVYDACYNVTEVYIVVHVRDETEPVAVCDRNTVVAITHNGYSWVPAEVFDDGSFDECALHHFEVRRMDRDFCGGRGEDDWGAEVGFCCEDVGKMVMVGFKAIDHSGNEAICMVNVEVQDKDRPLISCPPNITVDCRFDIDREHLEVFGKVVTEQSAREKIVIDPRYWHQIGGHPLDGLAEDNCPPEVVEELDYGGVNQCGLGTIVRIFYAEDQQGNRSEYCYQYITVTNHHVFDGNDIDWPDDYQTSNVCDPAQLIPERLSAPYDRPVVNDDECSLVGMSYHDHVLSPTIPGDPCFKIIRVWKVIDWCQRDNNNNVLIWQDTQYIKVTNLVDPTIDRVTQDTVICSYDVNCRPIPVKFSIEASDDCTDPNQMLYTYKIDLHSDGTIDVARSSIGGNVASGTWPIGKHLVKWEVEDRCGNTAKASFTLDLRNCKPPVAYCLNSLSTNLVPMDLDGDGLPDAAMDTIWAKDFDAGSYHNCGYKVQLSLSSDPKETYRIYDCDDQGLQDVELWVTDENGNQSHCKTFIDIQDNSGFCPPNIQNAKVEGEVMTEVQDRVENVRVEVMNSGRNEVMTNTEGKYAFDQLKSGQTYEVVARKTDGWLNGVTTADIVKIQRHILGLEPLSTAYKMIAADVNRSGEITAKDVSELRRLILGITTEINGNTSWRFVNGLYSFNDVSNTLKEQIPETYQISNLNKDLKLDFYAVKVGDVTGNAATKGYGQKGISRSRAVLELMAEERRMERGETGEIVLVVKKGKGYSGLQFTLEWMTSKMEVLGVEGNKSKRIGEEHYAMQSMDKGQLSFSWNGTLEDGQELIKLQVKALENLHVSDVMRLSDAITPSLSVNEQGEEELVTLLFDNGGQGRFTVLPAEPNPWNQMTTIGFYIPESGLVNLTVYDLTGKIHLVEKKEWSKGYHELKLDGTQFEHAGVYYYQLDYKDATQTGKMVKVE